MTTAISKLLVSARSLSHSCGEAHPLLLIDYLTTCLTDTGAVLVVMDGQHNGFLYGVHWWVCGSYECLRIPSGFRLGIVIMKLNHAVRTALKWHCAYGN